MSQIWIPARRKIWTPSRKLQRGFVCMPAGIGGVRPSGGSAFLLDTYGANCVGAWSATRKLRNAATNPLKAYWNSGSNSQDIGFDGANLTDTAAMSTAVGSGTARIELYDQSGNSRHLTHGTFGTRPRAINAGSLDTFGGFFAPYYAGAQELNFANWASATSLSGNPAFSVFIVYAKTTSNGHLWAWGNGATSLAATGVYDDGSTNSVGFAGGNNKTINAASTSTLYLLTVIKAAGQISTTTSIYRNGSSVAVAGGSTSTPNISSSSFPFRLGSWASGTSFFLTGHILEAVVYAADKSSDRTAIESDIRGFYGL